MQLFKDKKIRSVYDNTSKKHWFSVIDICAALRDCDYNTARNYWKWLKHKLFTSGNQLVSVTNQLKFEALDGKLRFTDVMDAGEVLQLIQICPSPKAEAFKLWIANLVTAGADVVGALTEAVVKAKDKIKCKAIGLLKTMRRKDYCLFGGLQHLHHSHFAPLAPKSYPDLDERDLVRSA